MFTGLIEGRGKVVRFDGKRAWIRLPFRQYRVGESIAVDGVCLTVAEKMGSVARFDVGPETARITTIGRLKKGRQVNLERALRVGDRLGGHWVTGHVEDTGTILRRTRAGRDWWFIFRLPRALRRYVVAKGSLAIDGISLTVVSVRGDQVKVMIIPHTLSHTTLGGKVAGERVNLEPDILAKYVLRQYS